MTSNQKNNLTDFFTGINDDGRLDIEISIKASGKVILFHSHPLKQPLAWFEFHLENNSLIAFIDNGDSRDAGLPLPQNVAKHMHNAHQILTVEMDPKTGDAKQGDYIPLIIHKN